MIQRAAFTMVELVFVIVVLGILGSVVFPKLAPFLEDAQFARGQSNVASIRSAIINQRSRNMLDGNASFPQFLDDATANTVGQELFDGNGTVRLLQYPLYANTTSGNWMKLSTNNGAAIEYRYYLTNARTVDFNYTKATGVFDCNHANNDCVELTR